MSGINRRSIIAGCTCLAGLMPAGRSFAQVDEESYSQHREFMCCTIEPPREADVQAAPKPDDLTSYGTAFIQDRWTKSDGNTPNTGVITLGVFFMDGTESQRRAAYASARAWHQGGLSSLIQLDFSAPMHRSQIRVSFGRGEGNWSYVGRNNKRIPPNQKTMNIDDLVPYVVMHEFGHAIGLQHEHMHPSVPIVWDEGAVIADMAAQGWSEAMTRENILTRYGSSAACVGDPQFNRDSIMMYPIPRHWTKNRVSFGQVSSISGRDRACVSAIYKA